MDASECQCKPGSYATGWQEIRSAACLRAEREALGTVVSWLRQRFIGGAS